MPRNRKDPAMSWLPPRVYIHRNNYVLQPKAGGKIILCPVTAGKIEILKRYEQEKGRIDAGVFFSRIVEDFYKSFEFTLLGPRTQQEYERQKTTIVSVFGKMRPNTIEPHHVKRFMTHLAKTKGKDGVPANPTANRYKACLQKICTWAVGEGRMKVNPCVGIEKFREKSRDRYITDGEYNAILSQASPLLRVAMEISYLCMARLGDVVSLTMHDVLEEGVFIAQGKTGKKQIKSWSDRLRGVIAEARALPRKKGMATIYLLCKADGSKYGLRSIQAHFEKARDAAGVVGCTFHDIKAKAVSDFEGTLAEKSTAAGHTNLAQTDKYDRKTRVVKPVR